MFLERDLRSTCIQLSSRAAMSSGDAATKTKAKGISRCSNYSTCRRAISQFSDHQPVLKRSKLSSTSSAGICRQSELMMITNIEDLPEFLLVEILCRLPRESVFECKRVSKRWSSVISDLYFVGRFLYFQSEKQNAIGFYLLHKSKHKVGVYLTTSSKQQQHPVALKTSNLSLSFVPCFRHHEAKPIVLGAYNDLLLCCATELYQRDYYICNPYTNQCVALPPTPRVHISVSVGFICDSYYNYQQQQASTSTTTTINGEYRWKVVRIVPVGSKVEIFSSETREWRELVVLCPRPLPFSSFPDEDSGVAYNGRLYWLCRDGFTFELDLLSDTNTSGDPHISNNNNIAISRFIDTPNVQPYSFECQLGVCRGRLRMCPAEFEDPFCPLRVWELKEEVDGVAGCKFNKWCLVVDRLSVKQMLSKNPNLKNIEEDKIWVLGFHPNNEDILYLQFASQQLILLCNLRKTSLEIAATQVPFGIPNVSFGRGIYPFVLPWWPTPVPS